MKVVVIYESMSGNARAIAGAIGEGLEDGNEVVVTPAAGVSADTVAGADLVVVGSDGQGLNEWFGSLGTIRARAAAFDTRKAGLTALTGRASLAIRRELLAHGFSVVDLPHSFLATADGELRPGEEERARLWGRLLLAEISCTVGARAADG